ncbi:MAG: inorganic phosphate transporter, partial [Xenococcus sp. (in: cyanobacteria)]
NVEIAGIFDISAVEQLFLLGAIAIAVGVFTYSKKVMMTVGGSLMTLSPTGAVVVVMSSSLVLFVFSSKELSNFTASLGLPAIPLIPVSSSQAVVGAVIGIAMLQGLKGVRQVKWGVLGGIASGWVTTPIIAAVIAFVSLFIVQNVFAQEVYQPVSAQVSPTAIEQLVEIDIGEEKLSNFGQEPRVNSSGVISNLAIAF